MVTILKLRDFPPSFNCTAPLRTAYIVESYDAVLPRSRQRVLSTSTPLLTGSPCLLSYSIFLLEIQHLHELAKRGLIFSWVSVQIVSLQIDALCPGPVEVGDFLFWLVIFFGLVLSDGVSGIHFIFEV